MNCLYCHNAANKSLDVGMPAVNTCMGCHTDRRRARSPRSRSWPSTAHDKTPVPWVRIHKVPEYVHFPHVRHVNAGVTCQTCHGQVQKMDAGLSVRVAQHGVVRQLPRERLRPEGRPEGRRLRQRAAGGLRGRRPYGTPGTRAGHAPLAAPGTGAAADSAPDATPPHRRVEHRSPRRRQNAGARATTARPATTRPPEDLDRMSNRHGVDGRQAPRLPEGPRRVQRRRRHGGLQLREGRQARSRTSSIPTRRSPGVSTYYATTCRECAAAAASSPRRATVASPSSRAIRSIR